MFPVPLLSSFLGGSACPLWLLKLMERMTGLQLSSSEALSLPIGFFAYTCGRLVVVEDLHSGAQQHWFGHPEEISTLALSHDAQVSILTRGYSAHHRVGPGLPLSH